MVSLDILSLRPEKGNSFKISVHKPIPSSSRSMHFMWVSCTNEGAEKKDPNEYVNRIAPIPLFCRVSLVHLARFCILAIVMQAVFTTLECYE